MLNRNTNLLRLNCILLLVIALGLFDLRTCAQNQNGEELPSWNGGETKKAITSFVARVTTPEGHDFVPVNERIAVSDNDGTLWAEQPFYFQLFFVVDRVKALAPEHPEWKEQEPFASLLKGDLKGVAGSGEKGVTALMAATHAGMTTDDFRRTVEDWLGKAKHPTTGRRFTEMVYRPMIELLNYLRANGFKTYIVSGGGIEFMRVFSEEVYGIPPEQVIGTYAKFAYEFENGKPVLRKLPELALMDDKEGKPVAIQTFIGRRPIAAFGNSDGDQQMLEWTTAGAGPRFGLIVHHTDAEREWAYDRGSHIGKLDTALNEAASKGWTIVNMKEDWNTVFIRNSTPRTSNQ